MNTIEKIRAEVERLENYYSSVEWYVEALLAFIDSLSEEPDKDDLEEAVENIYKVPFGTRAEDFKAGAEWQAKRSPLPEDTVLFNKGVAEGRRLEREDMLKEAVEGLIFQPKPKEDGQ